jgi:hypothetical protein
MGIDPKLFDNPNGPNMKLVQNKFIIPGSVGPIVAKGQAQTIKVPDGKGFFGLEGRQQNDNDKAQNNYSVTDANFNPLWGLAGDANGDPLNYVQQNQLYHAAGYLKTFAPEIYEQLVALQDAGKVSILDAAGSIMGMHDAPEAAEALGADRIAAIKETLAGAGIGAIGQDPRIPAKIPGTSMDAKTYVTSPKDATGQDWARMHHPESAMEMLKNLLEAGVPEDVAFVLAGDDGVSGAGRLNGFNNQDGEDSFNADEAAVFRLAAEYERQSGIPVVQIMMSGHDHTGLDDSAKTDPKINKILAGYGFTPAAGDDETAKAYNRQASPERAAALARALLGSDPKIDIADLGQHQIKNDSLQKAMDGVVTPMLAATHAQAGAAMLAPGAAPTGHSHAA